MDTITRLEAAKTIAFDKRVHPAIRVVIFLVGLLPLLGPYDLLFKARWETYLSTAFFLALFASLITVHSLKLKRLS